MALFSKKVFNRSVMEDKCNGSFCASVLNSWLPKIFTQTPKGALK